MQHNPGFLVLVREAKEQIKEIDVEAYKNLTETHLLIDVREDHEFAAGHAQGAMHLSKGIIERDIEAKVPDKTATLVLYCGGGYRSALAAHSLGRMGYQNVISLDGGWRAWTGASLPTEST